jgi:hypothetical protein
MNRRLVAILVVLCCGVGGQAAVEVASASPPAQAASCTYARIGGATKCLEPGEYCARRYQSQYRRHGFTCSKLDRRGDWHLERT